VLTAPPLNGDSFPYHELQGVRLFYLRLHGLPGQSYLYGDKRGAIGMTAFSGQRLANLDLTGLVVVMEGCYGAKTTLPEMFRQQGAAAVIASEEATNNRKFRVGPAGKFGKAFVSSLLKGNDIGLSLYNVKEKHAESARKFVVFGDSRHRI